MSSIITIVPSGASYEGIQKSILMSLGPTRMDESERFHNATKRVARISISLIVFAHQRQTFKAGECLFHDWPGDPASVRKLEDSERREL